MNHKNRICSVVALALFNVGCSTIVDPFGEDLLLPTGTPQSAGLVASYLENASNQIAAADGHKLHSMLVVRNGILVFEEYYNGYSRVNPHDMRSATKSITALLTGIAIERGFLAGVDYPVMDYLRAQYPDVQNKDDILIEHLLTMRTGLDCDDGDRSTQGQEDRMYRSDDWVNYFLSLSKPHTPGEITRYCTGGVVALGEAISQSTGRDFAEFADNALFSALGINNYQWARFDNDQKVDTGGHLLLTPQGMAKIGMLVYQNGDWDGQQIVSPQWIERSTQPHTEINNVPYGYLWRSDTAKLRDKDVNIIYASGNGGQTIFIVPEFNLVAGFTAGYYNSAKSRIVFELFGNAVLPSIEELSEYLN
jgi:CubicO group peptidase (beta-lactamase class C family)